MSRATALLSVISILCLGSASIAPLTASAQAVYKCVVNGKTVYQSTPCTSGSGKEVVIQRAPSQQDVEDAKARAAADKARATADDKERTTQRKPPAQAQAGASCDELAKRRALLYGQRNAAIRDTRGDGLYGITGRTGEQTRADEKRNDAAVDRANGEIKRLESQMTAMGCKLD